MPVTRDFDLLWDYNDPAATEVVFHGLLANTPDDEYRAELLTQIARTRSLRRKFDEAHNLLDEVDAAKPFGRVRVRSLLERGRTFNSAGRRDEAKPLFIRAFNLASELNEDFLAIDAAHMAAIAGTPDEALEWNNRGLAISDNSTDERARNWRGSLLNNLGWAHHEAGRFEEALKCFRQALDAWVEEGDEGKILIAGWCVARALRSLGLLKEALQIQRGLADTHRQRGSNDGYIEEEIGECLLALGQVEEAKAHFAAAYVALSEELAREPERLARLASLANA